MVSKTFFNLFGLSYCLLFIAVFPVTNCLAQEITPKTTLNSHIRLKDVIQEALDNNPALKASKYEALSKEAEIGPRGSYEDPMIGFEAMSYPFDTLNAREFGMTGNQLSISQKIPFPGKLTKLSLATTHEYNSKKEAFNNQQLQLIKDVRLAYFELFLAYKKEEITKEQLGIMKQMVAISRSRNSLGKITQAELLSVQLEEAGFTDNLLGAERLVKIKAGDLNRSLGRPSHHEIGKPEEIKRTVINFSIIDEEKLVEKIISKNPSIKSAEAELSSTETKLSYAKWDYLPDFEFRAAYTMRQPSPGDRGVNLVSGGVFMSIPIWAFSKQSEEVKSAAAQSAKADAMLSEERNHVVHSAHAVFSELQEANKRLSLFGGGLLPLALQSIQSGKSAYSAGKIEYSTLLNLIKTRFQTEFAYYEALVNYETKIAELEALLGEPIGG